MRWLKQLGGSAGLLLDPGGHAPLRIGAADLLVLDRWAAHPDRQPGAGEIMALAGQLLGSGAIMAKTAGRIAADFPGYWIAVREEGDRIVVLTVPKTDGICLFTSEQRAHEYVAMLTRLKLAEEFTPRRMRFGWSVNPLVLAHDSYGEAWIDPVSIGDEGGLRLSTEALRAALARLDETLKPRVPGFLAE